jgi:stearoyl-CoA desaturase (Delta-9 desaturase)
VRWNARILLPMTDPSRSEDRLRPAPPVRVLPILYFAGIHLLCLAVIWTGVSWVAVATCVAFYALRMFGLTAGYHRYLAHRSYSTSRAFRFALATLGTLAVQRGPLWWASTHRAHHRNADTVDDVHSPRYRGFWWAHFAWIVAPGYTKTDVASVRDLARHWELRWLDRLHFVPPVLAALALVFVGWRLGLSNPELGTGALQLFVWGFGVSTVLLYHGTWLVNSAVHKWGSRRFDTPDDSRNNVWVALVTGGEGWHNNHHRFPASERQGFYWWEIDLTHLLLSGLARLGIVWDLVRPPATLLAKGRRPRSA